MSMLITKNKVFFLLTLSILLTLHFHSTYTVHSSHLSQRTLTQQGASYTRPSFLSESGDEETVQPHIFATKSRGRSRSSYVYIGGRSYSSSRNATWQETLIGFGVIFGFVLLVFLCAFACEKCGCVKNRKKEREEHMHHQAAYPYTEIDH